MVSILPLSELKEKTLAMSAFFETSKNYPESYGTTSGNHDGAGLSHGVLQYNFGTGSLKPLWSHMITNYKSLCESIFGSDYAEWEDVVMNRTTANQVAWGDSISTPKDGSSLDRRFVIEPWNSYFMKLGTTQESIDKQVSMSDSWRVNADNWFNQCPKLWSRKAYFLMWDISVQMGRANFITSLNAEYDDPANTTGMTELQAEQWRCDRLAWHSAYNNAVSSANQAGVFKRKDMIAKETGDWWGSTYNGVTFDAILEPAFAGEITYAYPVITLLTDNNPRAKNAMSANLGFNSTAITISFDQAITKYSVNRGGTSVDTGVVLESGTVSYTAGQQFTITIDNTDLVTGENQIFIYGLNAQGLWSDGVTVVVTKPSYRYIKFEGYGTSTDLTTRAIELEVWSGGVNRVANKTPLAGYEPVSTGTGTPSQMFNGTKTTTTNSYPIWWTTAPNGRVVVDMGAQYAIDKIVYCSYSISGTQRANRFKILGSNTNNGTDWATIWDMSTTTELQPILPAGYEKTF